MNKLYKKYPGEFEPQPAFVEIDLEKEEVRYDYNPGSGVPLNVFHGRAIWLKVDARVNTEALDKLLESQEWKELLQTVFEDSEIVWNGSNHVGRTGRRAEAALQRMEELLAELPIIEVWEAEEWLSLVLSRDNQTGLWLIQGNPIRLENIEELLEEFPEELEDPPGKPIYVYRLHEYLMELAEENEKILEKGNSQHSLT